MITTIISILILLLASYSDLKKTVFKKRKIPNIYFLPLPLLVILNTENLISVALIFTIGIILNQITDFGLADNLALTTIASVQGPPAILSAITGAYITSKTIFRKNKEIPAIPGITLGYLIYLTITII